MTTATGSPRTAWRGTRVPRRTQEGPQRPNRGLTMGKRPDRRESFVVRPYVADREATAVRAIANLEGLCREFLPRGCELRGIDILREPQRGLDDSIMVTPTLIKLAPPPFRRIFGDLSNRGRLLDAVGLTGLDLSSPRP